MNKPLRINQLVGLLAYNRGLQSPFGSGRIPKDLGNPPKTCQWINGEGRDRDFCGKPVTKRANGSPSSYCQEHHDRCYVLDNKKPSSMLDTDETLVDEFRKPRGC